MASRRLTSAQRRFVAAVARGQSPTAAATSLGYHHSTGQRWATALAQQIEDARDVLAQSGPIDAEPQPAPQPVKAPVDAGRTADDLAAKALMSAIGSAHSKVQSAETDKLAIEALRAQTAAASAYSAHIHRHDRNAQSDIGPALIAVCADPAKLDRLVSSLPAREQQLLLDACWESYKDELARDNIELDDENVTKTHAVTELWLDPEAAAEWHGRWGRLLAAMWRDADRLRSLAAHRQAAADLGDPADESLFPPPSEDAVNTAADILDEAIPNAALRQ